MRFEAKHQQLKKIPKTTKNSKNLPKTSSERHKSGVRADAIPLTSDPSAWADEHPLFQKEYSCKWIYLHESARWKWKSYGRAKYFKVLSNTHGAVKNSNLPSSICDSSWDMQQKKI